MKLLNILVASSLYLSGMIDATANENVDPMSWSIENYINSESPLKSLRGTFQPQANHAENLVPVESLDIAKPGLWVL